MHKTDLSIKIFRVFGTIFSSPISKIAWEKTDSIV